jgi:hypothetical protein
MKSTKTKTKVTKSVSKKAPKAKGYEAHYLAVILIAFLLLEGLLITSTQVSDWQRGVSVLDMSTAVAQTSSDFMLVMQPVADAIAGVNQFYQIAATEMMYVLDLSEYDPLYELSLVIGGVNAFYQEATVQLTQLLDFSDTASWPAQIAGVSVSY